MRLAKVIRFGRLNVELIGEAFNLLNHPNVGSYLENMRSSDFGKPADEAAGFEPRQIQVGARIEF